MNTTQTTRDEIYAERAAGRAKMTALINSFLSVSLSDCTQGNDIFGFMGTEADCRLVQAWFAGFGATVEIQDWSDDEDFQGEEHQFEVLVPFSSLETALANARTPA